MSRRQFMFEAPDRFVTGTVGLPGQRIFYLQARTAGRIVSVSLEKVQVAVLADRLGALVIELAERGIGAEAAEPVDPDMEPLDEPINEAFRATSLTLGWDPASERFIVEAHALPIEEDGDEDEEPESIASAADLPLGPIDEEDDAILRVALTPEATRSFVERAVRVLRSGRPPCPLCGAPLEASGHICPRGNGHYVN
ncbi:MAG: DUF3090 domain-containing protein [Chloroflexota bacterium]